MRALTFSRFRGSATIPGKVAADVLVSFTFGSAVNLIRGFSVFDKLLSTNSSSNFLRLIDRLDKRLLLLCKSLAAIHKKTLHQSIAYLICVV